MAGDEKSVAIQDFELRTTRSTTWHVVGLSHQRATKYEFSATFAEKDGESFGFAVVTPNFGPSWKAEDIYGLKASVQFDPMRGAIVWQIEGEISPSGIVSIRRLEKSSTAGELFRMVELLELDVAMGRIVR